MRTLSWGWQTWWGSRFHVWSPELQGDEANKALFDAYTFAHTAGASMQFLLVPPIWLEELRVSPWLLFFCNLLLHAGFEVLENAPCVILFCRRVTIDKAYAGDSVVNSIGDLIAFSVSYGLCQMATSVLGIAGALLVLTFSCVIFSALYFPATCRSDVSAC